MLKTPQLELALMRVVPRGVTRGRQNPLRHRFPLRLRQARTAAGLSMARLCDLAQMSRAAVSRLEGRQGIPLLSTVERLANVLQVSPGWLTYGLDGPWTPAPELRCLGLAARLSQVRQELGLSLRDVSKAARASAPAISLLEGGSVPTIATLEDLAVALDVSPGWLAFGEGIRDGYPVRRAPRQPAAAPSL